MTPAYYFAGQFFAAQYWPIGGTGINKATAAFAGAFPRHSATASVQPRHNAITSVQPRDQAATNVWPN